jgi:NTP pyrophosphatase (non-canonical NTP hydrolase)
MKTHKEVLKKALKDPLIKKEYDKLEKEFNNKRKELTKMNFDQYQEEARKTAIYPNVGNNFIYPTLGLCGESGEVAEKIKKVIRDNNGILTDTKTEEIAKELGDVLWYIANICEELNIRMDKVALLNLSKLKKRQEENKVHGDGDNR